MRIKRFLVALAIGGVSLVAACGDDVSGGPFADGGGMDGGVLDGGLPLPPPPPPPSPPMPPYVNSPRLTEGR
jgi:hypothetical protein